MESKKIDFDKLIIDLEQGFTVQDAAELQGIKSTFGLYKKLTLEQKSFVIATRKGNENKIPHKKRGYELKAFKLKKRLDIEKKETDIILTDKNNIISDLTIKISQLEYDLSTNEKKESNNSKELNDIAILKKEIGRLYNIHENDVITIENYLKLIDDYKNIITKYEGGDKLIFDKTEYEKSVKPILEELEELRSENRELKGLNTKGVDYSNHQLVKENDLLKDNLASFKLKIRLLTKDYEALLWGQLHISGKSTTKTL